MKSLVKVGEFVALLELIRTDAASNVLEHRQMRSDSFVRQFLDLMYIIAAGSRGPVRNTANALTWPAQDSTIFNVTAGSGTTSNGIVVGSGSAPVTLSDYKLQTPIAHGTGSGQLNYGSLTFGAPTTDGTISLFRVTRPFSNGSGGAVTVREIGIYVNSAYMIVRDVLASPLSLPNGQTLTVNYQICASV